MCWAFALFDIGFVIATLVRSILTWCAHLPTPRKQFATAFYWDLVIHVALFLAFASTTCAIFLLNMTVLRLPYPRPRGDQEEAELRLSPAPGAILAMSVLGASMFTIMVVLALRVFFFVPRNLIRPKVCTEDLFV
jgi:hypothetical protein